MRALWSDMQDCFHNVSQDFYHLAAKDGILNSRGISMRSDGITYLKFLRPRIFNAIPCERPGYLNKSRLPYILLKFITRKLAISGSWLLKKFGCITYSENGLSRICIGDPMAWVHSNFVRICHLFGQMVDRRRIRRFLSKGVKNMGR